MVFAFSEFTSQTAVRERENVACDNVKTLAASQDKRPLKIRYTNGYLSQ